jgi:hypothetical protein
MTLNKWAYLATIYFTLFHISCNLNELNSPPEEGKNSGLHQFFNKNQWQYPIEINISNIGYENNLQSVQKIDPEILKQKIAGWCKSDSTLIENLSQAVRVYNIIIGLKDSNTYKLTCQVDFYREAEIKDGAAAPVEGHAIIENKFLRQRETAALFINHDSLSFSHWVVL